MSYQRQSLEEVFATVPTQHKSGIKKVFAFAGPAYLVSIGYMDPGNWATDLAGGSQFGFQLIWVLLMSNVMAIFLQSLAARLGIVYGKDLAQANRDVFPRYINLCLYVLAELAIIATDLAEVVGTAIGLQLLFDLPIMWGASISLLDTFLILYLQRLGIRKIELLIISLIAIIAGSFIVQLFLVQPSVQQVAQGFIPHIPNNEALYIAIGIIGATIMPHNLYLHSALVQTRHFDKTASSLRKAIQLNFMDSVIALNMAFFINASILILGASVFYLNGYYSVVEIQDAHQLLAPLLGSQLSPILFAIALIAAGQSSTITGTLSGQIVMEGYLHLRLNPWLRRLITRFIATAPVLLTIYFFDVHYINKLLILSQVVLSCQLGFAIIPLIHFVSHKTMMHNMPISKWKQVIAWLIVIVLITLNLKMGYTEISHLYHQYPYWWAHALLIVGCGALIALLLYIIIYPFVRPFPLILRDKNIDTHIHPTALHLKSTTAPPMTKPQVIAIALDFTPNDDKLIQYGVLYAQTGATFVLIHIVESVGAQMLGNVTNDLETRKDAERLNTYKQTLIQKGFQAEGFLGFRERNNEIVNIVHEQGADLFIAGSHGHKKWGDWIFGETIDDVRHRLRIPVLIVQL